MSDEMRNKSFIITYEIKKEFMIFAKDREEAKKIAKNRLKDENIRHIDFFSMGTWDVNSIKIVEIKSAI